MNRFRKAFLIIQIVPLIVFICYTAIYGCSTEQLVPVLWLSGHFALRMLLLLGNYCKPPYKKFKHVLKVYYAMNLVWAVYGLVTVIWTGVHLKKTGYVQSDSPVWMIVTQVFIVDVYMMLQASSRMIYWKRQFLENTITNAVQSIPPRNAPPVQVQEVVVEIPPKRNTAPQPGVQTHSYYTECAVCKIEFTKEDMVKDLPCKHLFHPGCIDPWLERQNRCPLCNFELTPVTKN